MSLLEREHVRLVLFLAYIASVLAAFVYLNLRLNVEWVFVILFFAAVVWGRGRAFLIDWSPFLIVLLAWQFAAPLAVQAGMPWHLTELMDADRFLFRGAVPAQWLQQHLHHQGVLEPWDVLAAATYMSHFLMPLVCGFLLWISDRSVYRRFAVAFTLLALGGFMTYVLYPSVAPWMAAMPLVHEPDGTYTVSSAGTVYLHGVQNLFQVNMGHWFSPYHGYVSVTWWGFQVLDLRYNPVAEIPSEHAAFPMLFFLFLRYQFGRWGYLALPYIGLILFAILYLGMHWFVDALIGFAYAVASYVLVIHLVPWVLNRVRQGAGARLSGVPSREA